MACARKASRSSVDASAQCRSSSTSTTGAVALRRLERRAHRFEQVQLRLARVALRGRRERGAGQQARQLLQPVEDGGAPQRPQRLDEREVGERRADEVDAPSREHGRASPARPFRQLAGQPRLADAGRAGDERGRAMPRRRCVERLLEPRQLPRTADEPVPHGRHRHRRRLRVRRRRRGRDLVEGRILVEDAVLQLSEARRRIDSQLVAELGSQLLEDRERLGVPSLPVQRQHQLAAEALAERVARDEALQLLRDVAMRGRARAPRRPGPRRRASRSSSRCAARRRGERLRELAERGPAPERARRGEALGRRDRVAVGERLAALLAQALEPQQVDRLRRDLEPVARADGSAAPRSAAPCGAARRRCAPSSPPWRARARPTGRRRAHRPTRSGSRRAAGGRAARACAARPGAPPRHGARAPAGRGAGTPSGSPQAPRTDARRKPRGAPPPAPHCSPS